jgi:hypothetical protein
LAIRQSPSHIAAMNLDLSDEAAAVLTLELHNIVENDRYPFSPRIRTLKGVLAKLRPEPVREPLPPPKVYGRHRRAGIGDAVSGSGHRGVARCCRLFIRGYTAYRGSMGASMPFVIEYLFRGHSVERTKSFASYLADAEQSARNGIARVRIV